MALYLGNEKVDLYLDGNKYRMMIGLLSQKYQKLLSSDGYVLADLSGRYLTFEEVIDVGGL